MKIKTSIAKYLSALSSCLLAVSSPAAVIVSQNSSAPTEDIISSNVITTGTPGNITAYKRTSGNLVQNIGQGFSTSGLTSDYSMTAATFFLTDFTPSSVEGKGFEISLYEVPSGSTASTAPGATLISSQTGNLPTTLVSSNYITFSLDTPVTLSANKFYVLMYSFTENTGTTTANSVSFTTIGSSSGSTSAPNTSGGYRWQQNDSGNNGSARNGFVFFVEATAIPEPSTYLLLGAGVLTLVIFRKRRHA